MFIFQSTVLKSNWKCIFFLQNKYKKVRNLPWYVRTISAHIHSIRWSEKKRQVPFLSEYYCVLHSQNYECNITNTWTCSYGFTLAKVKVFVIYIVSKELNISLIQVKYRHVWWAKTLLSRSYNLPILVHRVVSNQLTKTIW